MKKNRKKDKKSTDEKLMKDGKDVWRTMEKKDKKKWVKMLEPQRQRYIEAYTSKGSCTFTEIKKQQQLK